MGSLADQAAFVKGADLEGELAAVDRGEPALRPDLHPHGGRGLMADGEPGADRALPLFQFRRDRVLRGLFHQGDHVGRRKDMQIAGPDTGGCVPVVDRTFRVSLNIDFKHDKSLRILHFSWLPVF